MCLSQRVMQSIVTQSSVAPPQTLSAIVTEVVCTILPRFGYSIRAVPLLHVQGICVESAGMVKESPHCSTDAPIVIMLVGF